MKLSIALVLSVLLAVVTAQSSTTADVIVIGAGISGIAAARKLVAAGVKVIVLEGRMRKGGRLHTVTIGNQTNGEGVPIDLGGAWIQGITGNPLTKFAQDYGLELAPATRGDTTMYGPEGQLDDALVEAAYTEQAEFVAALEAAREAGQVTINNSVQDAYHTWLQTKTFDPATQRVLNQTLNSDVEQEYGASLRALSALYFDGGEGLGGGSVLWKQGYITLIEALSTGLDIRFGQNVRAVDYTTATVTVTTAAGITYTAPYVISTLPLGVLKSRKAPVFTPAFTGKKANAIATLGMGLLNKEAGSDWINYVPDVPGAYSNFLSCHYALGKPVIIGLIAGDFAWRQELQTDASIVANAMSRLRTMFPTTYQPPIATRVTRWGQDPWTYGSYAFIKAGAPQDGYASLAEPLNDRLFFAGEATSTEYAATAHGAFMTGEREADRIIQLIGTRR